MDLNQVKTQIATILSKENIKQVYYVDDRVNSFQKKKEIILANLVKTDIAQDGKLKLVLSSTHIDTEEEQEFLINEITKLYTIENMVFVKALSSHFGLEDKIIQGDEDNDAFDIQKYFNQGMLKILEPSIAVDTISSKIASLSESDKILVLFDLDLKEAQGEFLTITGVDLVLRVKEKDNNEKCICSIFTHLVKSTGEEIAKRKEILAGQQGRLTESNMFVLAKKRKNNELEFGDGIKKVILNPLYEKVKSISKEVLEEAFSVSCSEIIGIDTYEFDHVILHASNIEGVWAGETLIRIFNVIFDQNVRQELLKKDYAEKVNPFFEKAIKLAKHTFPLEQKDIPNFNRNRIRNLELYTNDTVLNGLYEPINNGDIFELVYEGIKQYYILIGQECDLILRSNGKRNRKNEFFTLLKIDFKPKIEIQKEIDDFASKYGLKNTYFSNKFLLNNYTSEDSDLIGVVDFRNELMVYVSILDLVSFNDDGEAKFKLDKIYPLYSFSQSLRNRFDFVKQICQKRTEFLKNMENQLKEQGVKDIQSILNKLIESVSPTDKKIGNLNSYSDSEGFDFGVKRVKRLKAHWANRLLERYGYYLSRAAELPDYAEMIETKNLKV